MDDNSIFELYTACTCLDNVNYGAKEANELNINQCTILNIISFQ